MCKNCYSSKGRRKQAYDCSHSDRANYALGMCSKCYYKFYNKKLRLKEAEEISKEYSKEVKTGENSQSW